MQTKLLKLRRRLPERRRAGSIQKQYVRPLLWRKDIKPRLEQIKK